MLAIPALLLVLAASAGTEYRAPRRAAPQQPVTGPDETLSDDEVRARVASYLGAIDVPVSIEAWRALGPRAVPLLKKVAESRDERPSRRAAAVGGLSVIGGAKARELVLKTAQSEDEPFAVRAAALHGASYVLSSRELVRELRPVLEGARESAARATAAEVLASHAPRSSCDAIRAQVEREGEERGHFERALARCGAKP